MSLPNAVRRRLGILLAIVAVIGSAFVPTAAHAVPSTMTITGKVVLLDASGAATTGSYTNIEIWTRHKEHVENVYAPGGVFTSSALPAGDYLVRATSSGFAPAWAGSDSPYRSRAASIGSASGPVTITLRPGGAVSGSAGLNGPLPQNRPEVIVNAYLLDPSTGDFERASSFTTVDYSITSSPAYELRDLAPGTYAIRAQQWSYDRVYGDAYWQDADARDDATLVTVASGRTTPGIALSVSPWQWQVGRVAGTDRYGTSVAVTQLAFGPGTPVVYIANGANWPDALSAGPVAAANGGALLLTDPNALPGVVANELRRLDPDRVVVVGSSASITDSTFQQIAAIVPDIDRIGGRDRYETSRLLVESTFGVDRTAQLFLATGTNFPDALSVAPIAGRRGEAVLLVDGANASADQATTALIDRLAPKRLTAVGGEPSIRQSILDGLDTADRDVRRIAGRDRFETSNLLNQDAFVSESEYTFLTNENGFPDALSVSVVAAAFGANVSLVRPDCIRPATLAGNRGQGTDTLILLGSESTLAPSVAQLNTCRG